MTDLPERVERAFARHEAYEPSEGATFAVTTTPFEAVVAVRVDDGVDAEATVWVPTLSAAVAPEEDVADVVEDGWFDTFQRRLDGADHALARGRTVDPEVTREGEEVVVAATVSAPEPVAAADDARAFVEYVEGTYMEGVVPGYEYAGPVAELRERARQAGDVDEA